MARCTCLPRQALQLSPNVLFVKVCLGVNAALPAQRNPPQLKDPSTVDLALSYSGNIPIRGHYLDSAIYRDQLISVLSLDHRRCREKAGWSD